MTKRKTVSYYRGGGLLTSAARGVGSLVGKVLNKTVDLLPVELHIPGYQFCGPGTRLAERLERGEKGINPLDSACREHDLVYSKFSDNKTRADADRVLGESAWKRVTASDSSALEKAAAWTVTNLMKAKAKFGGGRRRKTRRGKKRNNALSATLRRLKSMVGEGLYLRPYIGKGKKKKPRQPKRKHSRI